MLKRAHILSYIGSLHLCQCKIYHFLNNSIHTSCQEIADTVALMHNVISVSLCFCCYFDSHAYVISVNRCLMQ